MFTLGATTRPARCCGNLPADTSWDVPLQQNIKFNWDNRSGSIIYRGQQLTAVTDNELYALLPCANDQLPAAAGHAVWVPLQLRPAAAGEILLASSRAPPDGADCA